MVSLFKKIAVNVEEQIKNKIGFKFAQKLITRRFGPKLCKNVSKLWCFFSMHYCLFEIVMLVLLLFSELQLI